MQRCPCAKVIIPCRSLSITGHGRVLCWAGKSRPSEIIGRSAFYLLCFFLLRQGFAGGKTLGVADQKPGEVTLPRQLLLLGSPQSPNRPTASDPPRPAGRAGDPVGRFYFLGGNEFRLRQNAWVVDQKPGRVILPRQLLLPLSSPQSPNRPAASDPPRRGSSSSGRRRSGPWGRR